MANYRIKSNVPDKLVPYFLSKDKVYQGGMENDSWLLEIFVDDEGEAVLIDTKKSVLFHPYKGNPLEEVN